MTRKSDAKKSGGRAVDESVPYTLGGICGTVRVLQIQRANAEEVIVSCEDDEIEGHTNMDGEFVLPRVKPGTVQVTLRFQDQIVSIPVAVEAGKTTRLDHVFIDEGVLARRGLKS